MKICEQISPEERRALLDNTIPHLSQFNRATILRMMDEDPDVDGGRVRPLLNALQDYLNRYMSETPAAHKWIILPCIYLTFVLREPMHPQQIVGWEKKDGVYICPARDETGICRWCVCE